MGNEVNFYQNNASIGIIPGAVSDDQLEALAKNERLKDIPENKLQDQEKYDPTLLARTVADVLYKIVKYKDPSDKPGHLDTEGFNVPFDKLDAISLGNGPTIKANDIFRDIARLIGRKQIPKEQADLLESQFPQFSLSHHYWGHFQLVDRRDDFNCSIRLNDAFNCASEVKKAKANPVATLIGHLLFLVRDCEERSLGKGSRVGIGFNSVAAVGAYVDVEPDANGITVRPADVQDFIASDESKGALLGPYQGFSSAAGARATEIALLQSYFPGLFVAGHVPTVHFEDAGCSVS